MRALVVPAVALLACGNILGVGEFHRGEATGGAGGMGSAMASSGKGGEGVAATSTVASTADTDVASSVAAMSASTGTVLKANGQPCADGNECMSAICQQSVCCATACKPCSRCDGAMAGTCTVSPPKAAPESPGCGGYLCDGVGAACPTSCLGVGYCSGQLGYYCNTALMPNQCVKKQALGASCAKDGAGSCASNHCSTADKVCCQTACNTPCYSCSTARTGGTNGTCLPTSSGLSDKSCVTLAMVCDGKGACM